MGRGWGQERGGIERPSTQKSWDIKNDRWNIAPFTVLDNIPGGKSLEHHIQVRDVVSVLRFLMGHGPFQENLACAPGQQYSNNECVYSEIHTRNR